MQSDIVVVVLPRFKFKYKTAFYMRKIDPNACLIKLSNLKLHWHWPPCCFKGQDNKNTAFSVCFFFFKPLAVVFNKLKLTAMDNEKVLNKIFLLDNVNFRVY